MPRCSKKVADMDDSEQIEMDNVKVDSMIHIFGWFSCRFTKAKERVVDELV